MRIVLAPDSFKDAASAAEACDAMRAGVVRVRPDTNVVRCPIADGGEGFAETLTGVLGLTPHVCASIDPLGRPLQPSLFLPLSSEPQGPRNDAAVELAAVAGLQLLADAERDPTQTTTYGLGTLLAIAAESSVDAIWLGIGGSATNDLGCGCAQALGVRFFDQAGKRMLRPITGGDLGRIERIDIEHRNSALNDVLIRVACDVTNPLTGHDGAAHVYAPQKGATPEDVKRLDAGLRHVARLIHEQLGIDVEQLPGAGAAGGMGAGAVAFLGGELVPGADLVLDAVGFDDAVKDADLVLAGEGRLDGQSLSGKAVLKVAQRAAKHGVPTVALVGSAADDADRCLDAGLHAYEVLAPGLPVEESIARTAELLADAAERVVRRFLA